MSEKVDEALATLSRVVPTRFSGEVAAVKAEIERLRACINEYDKALEIYVEKDMEEGRDDDENQR